MAAQDLPQRGAWFRTFGAWTTIRCKEYDAPPRDGAYIQTLPYDHYFGPVHVAVQLGPFVPVCVPRYEAPTELIWVNISRNQRRFCVEVDTSGWHGWVNTFVKKRKRPNWLN